ncbi:MAG TPA: hypothetical protein VNA25_07050 [Phycisphaerae bacterium]|nr:hypothetical protein [Phycisphaerae bacterium]
MGHARNRPQAIQEMSVGAMQWTTLEEARAAYLELYKERGRRETECRLLQRSRAHLHTAMRAIVRKNRNAGEQSRQLKVFVKALRAIIVAAGRETEIPPAPTMHDPNSPLTAAEVAAVLSTMIDVRDVVDGEQGEVTFVVRP